MRGKFTPTTLTTKKSEDPEEKKFPTFYLFLSAGTAYEIQREDNLYKTHNAPAQHHPLCGLRRGSSHKPKIRPYSELHCCSPSFSANCFLPNIVTAELYCLFFWRSQFNRRMQDIMLWIKTYVLPKICELMICFTVLKKKSDILMQSFFLLTHQYVIYMKQCIPF